jgi:hypothetical protein
MLAMLDNAINTFYDIGVPVIFLLLHGLMKAQDNCLTKIMKAYELGNATCLGTGASRYFCCSEIKRQLEVL